MKTQDQLVAAAQWAMGKIGDCGRESRADGFRSLMKSATLPSFWEEYHNLPNDIRQQARKAYQLWQENPWHRSLYFKCIIDTPTSKERGILPSKTQLALTGLLQPK